MSMSSTANETRGPELLISIWILEAVSGLFLALRIFCKVFRARGLWWDDHLLTLSWIGTAVTACFTTVAVSLGYGHHFVDLDPNNVKPLLLYVMVGGTPNMVAVATSKIAFALTLTRLTEGRTRAFLWFIIISVAVFMSIANILLYVRCSPVTKNWDMTVPGTCWDFDKVISFNSFAGAWSAAADFGLAFIGARTVWKLQMGTREKLGLAIAMSMGVFAGITSIMKSVTLHHITEGDFSWDAHDLLIWGQAETTVTIIAASIPVLRVLFKEVRGSNRSEPTDTYRSADAPAFRYKTALPMSVKQQTRPGTQTTRTTEDSESDRSTTEIRVLSQQTTGTSADWERKKTDEESGCDPRAS